MLIGYSGLLLNDLERTLTILTVSQMQMGRSVSNLESCLMMTNAPTSLKLWSERWKRPSERRSSHSKGSSYCREFTTTLMSYYCRTESNSLFLTQVKNTNVFLTCHCYILIWKYTWECNILYTGLEYFYTATFSLSGEWSAHSFF